MSLVFRLAANIRICGRKWGSPAIEAIASRCSGQEWRSLYTALEAKDAAERTGSGLRYDVSSAESGKALKQLAFQVQGQGGPARRKLECSDQPPSKEDSPMEALSARHLHRSIPSEDRV